MGAVLPRESARTLDGSLRRAVYRVLSSQAVHGMTFEERREEMRDDEARRLDGPGRG